MAKKDRDESEKASGVGRTNSPASATPSEPIIHRVATFAEVSYSGPLPPPEILRGYEEVLSGAAKRIFDSFDQQTKHRISMEKTVTHADIRRSYLGLAIGGLVAMTSILGGVFLVYNGHDVAGTTIATATVIGLVGVFVYGTSNRRRERTERVKLLSG